MARMLRNPPHMAQVAQLLREQQHGAGASAAAAAAAMLPQQQQRQQQQASWLGVALGLGLSSDAASSVHTDDSSSASGAMGRSEQRPCHQPSGPGAAGSATGGYVAGLLRSTAPEEMARVLSMTADDWREYKHTHFARLCCLLELVNRHDAAGGQDDLDDEDDTHGCGLAASDASATGASAASAAEAAVAPGLPLQAAEDGCGLDAERVEEKLQAVVDEGIRLSFLALFYNHLSIVSAATNEDLKQQEAPSGHWLRVVKRLHLTDDQLLHLAIISEEYGRLTREQQQQGSALIDQAASPSLVLAAEASIAAAASSCRDGCSSALTPPSSSGHTVNTGSASQEPAGDGPSSQASAAGPALLQPDSQRQPPPQQQQQQQQQQQPQQQQPEGPQAAGSAVGDGLEDLDEALQRHLRQRFLVMVLVGMAVFNTLSRVQIAAMTVGCYPFYPMLTAVAEAGAALYHQRQAKQRQQQEQGSSAIGEPHPSRFAQEELQRHLQQRNTVLSQQQQSWWQGGGFAEAVVKQED